MPLEGARELAEKLSALAGGVKGRALKKAVTEAMFPVYQKALVTIPVGTRSHITYKGREVGPGFAQQNLRMKTWSSKDKSVATAMIGVAEEAFYVLQFIELGTSKFPAAPWLLPAFESETSGMGTAVAAQLRERIERIAKARKTGAAPGTIRPEGVRLSSSSRSQTAQRIRATGKS